MHLSSLFSPHSIAVIGASTKAGSVGNSLTENLLRFGYAGKVYPVNPKAETLFGLPCYKNIADITDEVELAIIIIPAAFVPQALREAGEKGVRGAIIISSGFKETGENGKALELDIIRIAKEFDIALLGPNCLGLLHPKIGLNASFAKIMPEPGNIAFFSQSGALCTALLDLTSESLGFSSFVSDGNKALIGEDELLRYFAQDNETKVIAFYSEGMSDAEKIIEVGRAILSRSEPKPIIALKSGRTSAGTAASSSHTGALAGSDAAYQALFKQARMIRADGFEHLLTLLPVFAFNPLPRGKRLGIVTNAGGLGVLATDAAVTHGLEIATLTPETVEKLTVLPPAASKHNPIDVLGDALADRYTLAIEAVAADPQVDMLLVIVTPQAMTEAKATAQAIFDIKNRSGKPLVAVFSGQDSLEEGLSILKEKNIATVGYPEAGAQALAALATVATWRTNQLSTPFVFNDVDEESARAVIERVRERGQTTLYETEVWEVLASYGFHFLKSQVVRSEEEAHTVATSFSGPTALKIISPNITHKSDAGGVLLGVRAEEAGEKYTELIQRVKEKVPDARLEGALMVEMAPTGGYEIILGMKHEPGLGKLIMAGLGGIFVETFKDVTFRFAPMNREDASEMIHELRSLPLLLGTRGKDGIDIEALIDALGRLSLLIEDFPEIEELDINPLLTFKNGADFRILDARIRLKETR